MTAGKRAADHCNAHPGLSRYISMRQAMQSTAVPHNPAQPAGSSRPAQAAGSAQAPAQHASNMQSLQPLSSTQPYTSALHQQRLGSSAGRGRRGRGRYGDRWRSSSDLHNMAAQQASVNPSAGPSRLKTEGAPDPASASQAERLGSQFPANPEPASAPGRTATSQAAHFQPRKLLDQATVDDDIIAGLARPGMRESWPILNARGVDGLYAEFQARVRAESSANTSEDRLPSADGVDASASADASAGPSSANRNRQPGKAARLQGAERSADSTQRQSAPAGSAGSGSLTVAEQLAAAAASDVPTGAAPGKSSSNAAATGAQVSFILSECCTQ